MAWNEIKPNDYILWVSLQSPIAWKWVVFAFVCFCFCLLWEFLSSLPNFTKETSDDLRDVLPGCDPRRYYNISMGTQCDFISYLVGVGRDGPITAKPWQKPEEQAQSRKKNTEHGSQWKGKASLPESPSLKGCSLEATPSFKSLLSLCEDICRHFFLWKFLLLVSSKNWDKFIASLVLRTKWKLSPSYDCRIALGQS